MLIFDSKDTKSQLTVFHYIVGNCIWEQAYCLKFLFATLYMLIYAVSENERKRERLPGEFKKMYSSLFLEMRVASCISLLL